MNMQEEIAARTCERQQLPLKYALRRLIWHLEAGRLFRRTHWFLRNRLYFSKYTSALWFGWLSSVLPLSASYILGSMITFSLFITLAYVFHSICFLKVFATIIWVSLHALELQENLVHLEIHLLVQGMPTGLFVTVGRWPFYTLVKSRGIDNILVESWTVSTSRSI